MRRIHLISKLVFAGIFVFLACATAAMAVDAPNLPASFAGWTQSGGAETIGDPSDARWTETWSVLQEYGYLSGNMQQYTKGGKTISVSLYRMKDASGAYGIYSYFRVPGMAHSSIAEHSSMSAAHALVLDGTVVIEIYGSNGMDFANLEPDFKALVDALGSVPADSPYPDLVKRLPLRGFRQGTDRYILGPQALRSTIALGDGDWAGFANGAEAEVGQYQFESDNRVLTLIVLDYPTPQVATKMLKDWAAIFNLDAKDASSKLPAVYATRKLTTVGLVVGANKPDEAKALLAHLDSGEELTWNEPTFSVNEGNINGVIASVIVGTGILCMFTLVAGLAFGGVRLVAKRFLPGRVFDRGSSISVLQLGLGSKPINSDDFYQLGKSAPPVPTPRES